MQDKAEITLLRHRISDGLKGDFTMLDFKCSNCGVGINKDKETFVIAPDEIKIWCDHCWRKHGSME